jgi:hypothetical protein
MGIFNGMRDGPDPPVLQVEWVDILPGSHSGRSTLAGRRRRRTSTRIRVASLALTALVVVGGGLAFSAGLMPTGDQIRAEMARDYDRIASARARSTALDPAVRPGLDGVHASRTERSAGNEDFYRARLGVAFPAGRIVDAVGAGSTPLMPVAFVDTTGNGLDKVVRIRGLNGDDPWITAYMAAGGTVQVALPAGGYRVTVAEGHAWHDEAMQFGAEGRYYAPQTLDVRDGQSIRVELPRAGDADELALTSVETF